MICDLSFLNIGRTIMLRACLVVVSTLCLFNQLVDGESITNVAGIGADVVLRRSSATENDGFLRIKNQSGDPENVNNDRVGLIKFDLSLLTESISQASVRFELPRGASNGFPNNTFDAGETLALYGIPDLAADENFNEATVTFANSPYTTGVGGSTNPRPVGDLTGNGVNDTLLVLLDTYTFDAVSDAGHIVDFWGTAVTNFLQADTNGAASFFLTVSQSNAGKTAVFISDTGTGGTPPTILTNADAIVPEPATALLALSAVSIVMLSRRSKDSN
jgi:hypothetical protein